MPESVSSRYKLPRWAKRLLYTCIILFLLFIFKGTLYRTCVSYQLIGPRMQTDFSLHLHPTKGEKELSEIIDQTLDSTTRLLSFTTEHCATDYASLSMGGKTNCVGYANVFTLLFNDELTRNGLRTSYKAEPFVAELYLFGFDLHSCFNSPFWKNHDIVVITEKSMGKRILIDPTLDDYLGIGLVKERK